MTSRPPAGLCFIPEQFFRFVGRGDGARPRCPGVESIYGARTIAESAYTLDNAGNRVSVTDGGGGTTRYSYDKDYELTGVRYPDGRREEYTYDPAGNRISEDGTPYVYDPDNHLISAGREPYLYDENGNLVFGNNSLYLYDDENRLTNVLTLDGLKNIEYAYDGDGNRTSRSVSNLFDRASSIQSALNRELAHLLIPQSSSGKDKGLPWPGPAGRMDDGLASILRGIGVPPGLLNGRVMGDRGSISHEVYGPTEEYIYDFNAGVPRLLAEKDNGNPNDYLYDGRLYEGIIAAGGPYGQGPDGAVDPGMYGRDGDGTGSVGGSVFGAGHGSRFPGFGLGNDGYPGGLWPNPGTVPGGRIFYQQDGLGSVEAITNINGRVLERYSYDAFGEPRVEGERIPNPFMFTGEPYDQADGLLYLRARYYDPQIGRFLSQDSFFGKLTDPLSQNVYVYAENNPVLNVDPTGHGSLAGLLSNTDDESLIPQNGDWFQHTAVQEWFAYVILPGTRIEYKIPNTNLRIDLENALSIWEVKPNNARYFRSGPAQLNNYIDVASEQGLELKPGGQYSFVVPYGSGKIDVTSNGQDGMLYYKYYGQSADSGKVALERTELDIRAITLKQNIENGLGSAGNFLGQVFGQRPEQWSPWPTPWFPPVPA